MCEVIRTVHEVIKSRCPARVGLLGNPSDGFCGKTLSFALANYCAEVVLERADGIVIVPNPELDRSTFGTIEELADYTAANGYYGGVRLLQATIKAFVGACSAAAIVLDKSKGFRISYSSTIPRMVS
jgi:glucuronokinase